MEEALREKLGKIAHDTFYGKYGDWDTLPESDREQWRMSAEAVAFVAGILTSASEATLKALVREQAV